MSRKPSGHPARADPTTDRLFKTMPAAVTEALEQEVAELLYVTRDYTWQIQARRVIELLKGKV